MNKSNSGQIILILVLITIVGLTIGLSLISRTVTDVRISSQIEQSSRAFSAAEAGVETALKTSVINGPTGTISLNNAQASYDVSSLGDSKDVFLYPLTTPNSSQTLWLVPHNDDGSLKVNEPNQPVGKAYPANTAFDICFGSDAISKPALILSLFYIDGTTYKVAKLAIDSDGSRGNNFYLSDSAGNYCNGSYHFKKTLTPNSIVAGEGFGITSGTATLLAMRIHVLYSSTQIAIKPSTMAIPMQGKLISSTGETGTGITRKIQVNQGYAVLPALLDFALFREN